MDVNGEYKYNIVNGCFRGLYKSTYDCGTTLQADPNLV